VVPLFGLSLSPLFAAPPFAPSLSFQTLPHTSFSSFPSPLSPSPSLGDFLCIGGKLKTFAKSDFSVLTTQNEIPESTDWQYL
jgi:hypothetical protein